MRVAVTGGIAGIGTAIVIVGARAWRIPILRLVRIGRSGGGGIMAARLRCIRVIAAACRRRAVLPATIVLLRLGQAVVGLLDADRVPRLGVGREREARVAQQSVGDELRSLLPALRLALAPPRVVLERAGQHDAPR